MKEKIKRQLCDLWQNYSFFNFFTCLTLTLIAFLFLVVFGFAFCSGFNTGVELFDAQFTLSFLFLLILFAFFYARSSAIENDMKIEAECNCIIEHLQKRLDDFSLENLKGDK